MLYYIAIIFCCLIYSPLYVMDHEQYSIQDITKLEWSKELVDAEDKFYKSFDEPDSKFRFLGFLENASIITQPVFRFKQFSMTPTSPSTLYTDATYPAKISERFDHLSFTISTNNEPIPSLEDIKKTLIASKMVNQGIANTIKLKNNILSFPNSKAMIGLPFKYLPLLKQETYFYSSSKMGCKYPTSLDKELYKSIPETLPQESYLTIKNEKDIIRSFYSWKTNIKNDKKDNTIYFAELIDETQFHGDSDEHDRSAKAPTQHYISIYTIDNYNTPEVIATLKLPVKEDFKTPKSSEPWLIYKNARFKLETILDGQIIVYDTKYCRYACFQPKFIYFNEYNLQATANQMKAATEQGNQYSNNIINPKMDPGRNTISPLQRLFKTIGSFLNRLNQRRYFFLIAAAMIIYFAFKK